MELNAFLERIVDRLVESYAPPAEALDPEAFIHWRDTLQPFGGPTNCIDYLCETGVLK
ncbi:MAG: hypothetical protein K2Y27_00160 [Xanthobacteraceae bacterium]|nr:hypothetical protein [Xanthobacteraceae bacterium]